MKKMLFLRYHSSCFFVCEMNFNALLLGKNGLRALVVVVMALVLSLAACHGGKSQSHVDESRRVSLDSIMKGIDDVDSLEVMVNQFSKVHDDLGEMIALRHLGRLLRNQALYEQAIDVLKRGLDVAVRLADTLEICEVMNNLGTCNRRMGDLSAANGYHYGTLKYMNVFSGRDEDNAMNVKARALNGIGNIERILCHYKMADSVLHEAMNCELRVNDDEGVAINACDLGRVKKEMGQIDSAWFYYNKSMELSRRSGYEKGVALCHLHIGELHEQEQRFSHAVAEYELAYDQFKALDDSWRWQQSCLALARVNVLLDEPLKAHRYIREVDKEAMRTGCKWHLAESSMIHYQLSLLDGNTQEALNHFISGTELFDSIYGLKKGDEMRVQRIDYQNGVKSGQMDVLNRAITHMKRMRSIQNWLTFLLLAMAAAVIAALAYVMRERMRTQRLMRQIEETRSLFFTNVVHLLRTPLTAIMGAVDDITDAVSTHPDSDERQRENAQLIERQGKNLLTLMDRILEVGSVRSAVTELEWSTGDAVTYLRMLLDTYREQCVARHIELTYAPSEPSVTIDTVPRYLSTIVHSLIENAMNYCRDFSQITVTTQVEDDFFVIRVADNGMGITANDLPHVFEPFYRGAAAEQLIDGMGIGLTVVRDMTMALGGTVDVESDNEKGTVFTVKLPCRYSKKGFKSELGKLMPPLQSMMTKPQSHEKLPEVEAVSSAGNLPVVLVVEDNADVAHLVGAVLGKDYTVYYAQDGELGWAMACEHVPDLIITDVKMPLMDGYEFTRRVRASQHLQHIPVIILSARTSDEARVRGIQAGANAYLVKPFVKRELLAWVNNLLQMREGLKQTAGQTDSQSDNPGATMPMPVVDPQAEGERFLDQFAVAVETQMLNGDKVDMDKFALIFKMGESQLKRKIHELTGKNLSAYINQLRMEKAMRLLKQNPDMLVGDVAVECGFADVAYFSRVFRQYYGKTPTQARKDFTE